MHSFMYKGLGYKGSMYGCFQPGGLVPAVTASSVDKKGGIIKITSLRRSTFLSLLEFRLHLKPATA